MILLLAFDKGKDCHLGRAAYSQPGSYTLSVTADGAIVEVPEDSIVVYVNFFAEMPGPTRTPFSVWCSLRAA